MEKHFVLIDRGLQSSILQFARNQKAHVESELLNEDHEYFDSLDDARQAGMVILGRYEKGTKKAVGLFAAKPDADRGFQGSDRLRRLSLSRVR